MVGGKPAADARFPGENQIRLARGLEPLPDDPEASDENDEDEADAVDEKDDEFDVVLREAGEILHDWLGNHQNDQRLVDNEAPAPSAAAATAAPITAAPEDARIQ